MSEVKVGGPCGYVEMLEDGGRECRNMGLRFTVKDPFGNRMSIVRCIEHSDWISCDDLEVMP